MKVLLVSLLAISFGFPIGAYAEQGTFVDTIQFIQYLDENTALEQVKNGNLDLYYFRIPSDRIEDSDDRKGIHIFESTGGSYSILVNPAVTKPFNPFSINDVRYALNYLVDRKLIVNELMGGYGTTMISNYGPYDPDYLYILNELESFSFRHNPALAEEIISRELIDVGATKSNDVWMYDDQRITITIFIRSDDPVRKSIGEIISSKLESMGFKVVKDYGDLNKAFVVVYGSNPSDLKWNLYTEGWGGRSAFVKYDSVGLGQMYSPWFSNMPGFNDPSYWNYQNEYLDSITQDIYTANFSSSDERIRLIQQATKEGVSESVRIFLASKIDQYVVNENVDGVINDLGAGVPTRFTPINARTDSNSLVIGVKQIYQGSWNPVMGLSDVYSTHIWNTLYDPGVFKHPYTGDTIPIRTNWDVTTAGPDGKLAIPEDAIIWDPVSQKWENVGPNSFATSKVRFDLKFSNWHNGSPMDMNDILHSLYFTFEWGSEQQENDKTFDTEFTPRTSQIVKTMMGVKIIDEDTIDVYVDFWHFDEAEIADWASVWSSMPWEIFTAMENAVIDGKVSFSRSGAVSKNVNWLSLIIPNDAQIIHEYLESYRESEYIPPSLKKFNNNEQYFESRYDSSINWIQENGHAVISNGPFYLDNYSPESRTITVNAFTDDTYPFDAGAWQSFEYIKFPKIVDVSSPSILTIGTELEIPIFTQDSSIIHYFFTNSKGEIVSSGIQTINGDQTTLHLSAFETSQFKIGANNLKIFAVSEHVLRPDIFTTSFLVVKNNQNIPDVVVDKNFENNVENNNFGLLFIMIGIVIVGIILYKRRQAKRVAKLS